MQNMFGKEIHKTRNWCVISKFILTGALFLTACDAPVSEEKFETDNDEVRIDQLISGYAQGTSYTIITGDDSLLVSQQEIDNLLKDFDTSLSSYIPESIVSRFNVASPGVYYFDDQQQYFQQCIEESMRVYDRTKGAFDPTVYPLVAGWGFLKDPGMEMDQHIVDSLLAMTGFRSGVDFDYKNLGDGRFSLTKKKQGLRMDFNAIAQGLSVDVVAKYLEEKGHENYFVEIGGEVRVKGRNREGHFWRIGVDAPKESNDGRDEIRDITNVVNLRGGAVATSGNYRKYYEKDGIKYSHTINPVTGYPVQHTLLSATVWSAQASTSDAYATAFMVMGTEKAMEFLETNSDLHLEVLLIFTNKKGRMEKFFTPGMKRFLD